jgi:hypothetical protein
MYRARYILSSQSQGVKPLFNDPIGWDEDTRSLVRDSNSFGILYDFATDLEFVKDGYDFITSTERQEGGFEARVFVKRQILVNDAWEDDYTGEVDLLSKVQTRLGVKVSLFNGGLTQELKSNISDKFELDTLESVNGETLEALELDKGVINGRDLQLNTLLEDSEEKTIEGFRTIVGGSTDTAEDYYIPKAFKTFSGDPSVQSIISTPLKPLETNAQFRPSINSTQPFLFKSTENASRLLKITIDCDVTFPFGGNQVDLILFRYLFVDDSNQFQFAGANTLKTLSYNGSNGEVQTINEVFDVNQSLNVNESLVLAFYIRGFVQSGSLSLWSLTQRNFRIEGTQTSVFPSTRFSGLTIKKAGERLSKIVTGKNVFKSDYFTNDTFKDVLITSGKKVRGFPDSIELSFKHLFDSAAAVLNSYYGVETINEQERIVLEPLDYFFRSEQILDLGRVSDVERSYSDKLIYNSIDIGYKKGGDYEENQGLDEYNTNSSFTHGFKNADSKKDFLSDIRADTIGIEITRRKQFSSFPTEDTQQDKDNFFIDCVYTSNFNSAFVTLREVYFNRRYELDFSSLPTGIFSPETAYNLRLTPVNNLFRNSSYLSYLSYFQSSKTRFVSALRNSNLVTQLIGQTARAESGDYVNDVFKLPLFEPIEITFKHRLSQEDLRTLTSATDGVPNYYKLIRFEDDEQQINYGYLMSYEPRDEGTFTVLKANLTQSATQDIQYKRILASNSTILASSSTILASTTIQIP